MSETAFPPLNLATAILSIAAFVFVGLSASWWVLYYTDWFPVVLGLLGLGGFFAWIAFVINLLTDERKKQIQSSFDRRVLQSPATVAVLVVVLLVGWLGFAPFRGTLLVQNLASDAGHRIEVSRLDADGTPTEIIDRQPVVAGETVKILLPTGWFGSRDYHVKLSGLPSQRVTLRSFFREKILAPDTLLGRPVLLLRPAAKLAGPVSAGFSLRVLVEGKPFGEIKPYDGGVLWIGAEADVVIPRHVVERWRFEFLQLGLDPAGVINWSRPKVWAKHRPLPAAVRVRAELLNAAGDVKYAGETVMPKTLDPQQFPMELILIEAR